MFHAHIDKLAVLYIVNLKNSTIMRSPHYFLSYRPPGGFHRAIPRSGIAEIPILPHFANMALYRFLP
jgi:hypothetical protein